MSGATDDRRELIVAYLLGELDAGAARQLERDVERDEALRAELEALRPTVTRLAELPPDAWESAQPPPLRPPETSAPAHAEARSRARRWGRGQIALTAGAAAAALAVGIAVGVLLDDGGSSQTSAPEQSFALRPIGNGGADASGDLTVQNRDRADLRVRGLPANRRDFYELWLLGDRGLVSLGSFRVNAAGEANVALSLPVDPRAYSAFDVSREPDDGDPSHSGDSILRGPT